MPKQQGLIPLRERVKEIEKTYYAAEKEIAERLFSFDIENYREIKAIEIQQRINKLIENLNRKAVRWAKNSVPEAYKKSHDISRTRLEILGKEESDEFDNKIHERSMDGQADKTMNDFIKANMSIQTNIATFLFLAKRAYQGLEQFQAFDLRDEEIIAGLLDDAMAKGETRGYAYKAVREHFRQRFGEAQFIRINARNYEMKHYARLVARTRLRVAQSEAVKNTCQQFNNDLVEISAHGTTTPICLPYEGNVYSISGNDRQYPFLDAWPPFHPNCMHHAAATSRAALGRREAYA